MASAPSFSRLMSQGYEENGERGISAANVPTAMAKFDEYTATVTSMFGDFKTSIDNYSNAFFGNHQNSVKGYVEGVLDSAASLLATLSDFKPKLETAASNYARQDATIADSLAGGAASATDGGPGVAANGNTNMTM